MLSSIRGACACFLSSTILLASFVSAARSDSSDGYAIFAGAPTGNISVSASNLVQCGTSDISWVNGVAPFTLQISTGGLYVSTTSVLTVSSLTSPSYSWTVTEPSGTSMYFMVTDSVGNNGYIQGTGATVGAGSGDTSCLAAASSSSSTSSARSSSSTSQATESSSTAVVVASSSSSSPTSSSFAQASSSGSASVDASSSIPSTPVPSESSTASVASSGESTVASVVVVTSTAKGDASSTTADGSSASMTASSSGVVVVTSTATAGSGAASSSGTVSTSDSSPSSATDAGASSAAAYSAPLVIVTVTSSLVNADSSVVPVTILSTSSPVAVTLTSTSPIAASAPTTLSTSSSSSAAAVVVVTSTGTVIASTTGRTSSGSSLVTSTAVGAVQSSTSAAAGKSVGVVSGFLLFFLSGIGASIFCKSRNCNSSIATRVGFGLIFAMSSTIAYIARSDLAIRQIEKLAFDRIKMDCSGGKCYGVLAVHRFCFALAIFHTILSLSLIGVKSTRSHRAAIQNGWWGPKLLLYFALSFLTFLIPNGFFMWYGSWISPVGAFSFILIGLVLLVDFAHTWSETCLDNWENSDSNLWQFILVGSTFGMYIATVVMTVLLYVFFAGSGCGLNTFFISANLFLAAVVTVLSISPAIQEANPKSGLAQASMVAAYCTYLTTSAVANHNDEGHGVCNPLHRTGTKHTTVLIGAIFTFLAIAYSTSRAATQSKALVGRAGSKTGPIALQADEDDAQMEDGHVRMVVASQPKARRDPMRYEAIKAAVDAGSLPPSALDDDDDEDEDEEVVGDDERTGTKYNYSWFHVIFIMAAMYVGGLLTDWKVVSTTPIGPEAGRDDQDVYIGRSEAAMWMRIVSAWLCAVIYSWSLLAPVLLPDRFGSD